MAAKSPEAIEYRRQADRRYYRENREQVLAKTRAHRLEHIEEKRARDADYYARNAERVRERARAYYLANPEVVRDARARRKARERGATTQTRYKRLLIFERDEWTCGICGDLVDRTLVYPDPMCASIDHIVLLSHGGSDTEDNVRCAHLTCNKRRPRGGD